MQYPSLGQRLSAAMVEMGQAIEGNATSSEISLVLKALLVDEPQVRYACLQALAVGAV